MNNNKKSILMLYFGTFRDPFGLHVPHVLGKYVYPVVGGALCKHHFDQADSLLVKSSDVEPESTVNWCLQLGSTKSET